jgi:AraC-like DNA-binding protein
MNANAIKRFLTALSSIVEIERGQLYQLIQSAETSYCLRDINSQHEIGLALQSFAYPFNQVGKYYESVFLYRTGQYEKARELLEGVAESAPARYRSKALLSLSAVEETLGRFEEPLRLRLSASTCDDPMAHFQAKHGIAVLRGLEGDHRAALRDLERLMPLAHTIGKRGHPAYFAFLNSYALELSESGKSEEAEQAANVVAASPFIDRYLEWQETVLEIAAKGKRRSMIAVPQELKLKYRDRRVQAAVDFMNANLHRDIDLDKITEAANVSISHLSRILKRGTGFPPIDYLIRLRLEKARQLLKTGFLSVKEVMAVVGNNSKGHFAKHFKKRFGVTPSEYKQQAFKNR